ncbi:hypothetical protein [Rhodococcus sp. SGAir0479]|uniref:hypothetical protein n=1 Tax=Rhodococcus sp. SGAir0479 TaxID=2567884 RepID=UPI0010CCB14A|nr:hypothetical protein [Rhodococcus sp. SGAir0479]QCQ91209.1 hypothetical protein E7742_08130 [Rhodococcus sp. SGAir0479]
MGVKFGVTAWGRAWLRTVESTGASSPNSLLPQARILVGKGSVTLIAVETGRIRAEVTVRDRVVPVEIAVPLWSDVESAAVRDLVARAGSRNRAVAAGEIPDSLVADLTAKSISVAGDPEAHNTTCACSGRKRPCLHHLAAIYQLVVQIDEEPALAVALRDSPSLTAGRTAAAADVLPLDQIDAATFYGD